MIFNDISTGAQNDLERATEIARSMVMDFGMSRLGRVNYRERNRSPFLVSALEMPRSQHHSEQTAREIDQEVKRIIDEGLQRTRHILEIRRAALEADQPAADQAGSDRRDRAQADHRRQLAQPDDRPRHRRRRQTPRSAAAGKPAQDIDASEMEKAEGV